MKYPLFKGATRLPTFFGIPRNVFLITLVVSATFFMFIHLYAIGVFAILFSIEYMLCKYDERIFRIISLYIQTKFNFNANAANKQFSSSDAITFSPDQKFYVAKTPLLTRLKLFFKFL